MFLCYKLIKLSFTLTSVMTNDRNKTTILYVFSHRGVVGSIGRCKRSTSASDRDGWRVRGSPSQEQSLPRTLPTDTRLPAA